jgi:hypothetical protein
MSGLFMAGGVIASAARRRGGSYESEIQTWIDALVAQGDSISSGNAAAWDAVVKGAKSAGYWSAIKCLVPIAGPAIGGDRAPVHIVGISPTIIGTFAADERTTDDGFVGNGSAQLNAGFLETSTTYFGGKDDWYWGVYVTRAAPSPHVSNRYYGGGSTSGGNKALQMLSATQLRIGLEGGTSTFNQDPTTFVGVLSVRRWASNAVRSRVGASTQNGTNGSGSPSSPVNLRILGSAAGSSSLLAPTAIGAYWTGTSAADEAHFRQLLDTCFAALT